jgi:hypothetical protein
MLFCTNNKGQTPCETAIESAENEDDEDTEAKYTKVFDYIIKFIDLADRSMIKM